MLIRFSAAFVLTLLISVSCASALAEGAPVNLCTADPEGEYFAAGRDIAANASPRFLRVSVVRTSGSMDNLHRMARGKCGAAIVQSDAFLVYQVKHRGRPVEITRNRFLFAEFAHLVCRRDAKVATTDDLLRKPERHRILVGAKESGSKLTWQVFTLLDRRYDELPIEPVGGEEALDRVLNNQAHCLFFVSGLGAAFGRHVERRGKDLRLVPITVDVLRNAEANSVTLYETRRIPRGTYSNLEKGLSDSGVETLSVAALLVIGRNWSERYRDGRTALLGCRDRRNACDQETSDSGLQVDSELLKLYVTPAVVALISVRDIIPQAGLRNSDRAHATGERAALAPSAIKAPQI